MKHPVTYLALALALVSLNCEAQKYSLTETKSNTVQRHFKKILIIGSGSVETRAFLDMLSSDLIARLQEKNMEATYYFNEKETVLMNNEMPPYLPDSVEAILVCKPIDSLHFSQIRYKRKVDFLDPLLGTPNYARNARKIDYAETFDIRLYSTLLMSDTIWAAKLAVDGDYSKHSKTNEIARKIISSLTSNKVLL